jgi:hypothetical protein
VVNKQEGSQLQEDKGVGLHFLPELKHPFESMEGLWMRSTTHKPDFLTLPGLPGSFLSGLS